MRTIADPVPCKECPLASCPGLRPHSPAEIEQLQDFKTGEIALDRGEVLIEQGSNHQDALFTVLDGVLMRHRSIGDGRRQIVNFMFPGDLVGLQAAFDEPSTHSVVALLPSRLCRFDSRRYYGLIVAQPSLGYDITWLAAKEERALEEHLVALGRRNARERVAYLALWLIARAQATCMGDHEEGLSVTITQAQIADMLGLSLVHTNRTIKSLERDGLVFWRQGSIRIPDLKAVANFAHSEVLMERSRPYL